MNDQNPLVGFDGIARLFPLPNFVMMPHVVKGFNIFEQRYREMTADALADDQLITLVLPKPGWEADYDGKPALHDVACLTRILTHKKLPDGRFDLLLHGVCRVRIHDELLAKTLYRQVRVEALPDALGKEPPSLRRGLRDAVRPWLPRQKGAMAQFNALMGSDKPLGALCDIIAFALGLPPEIKQLLLETLDVPQRADLLIHSLKAARAEPQVAETSGAAPEQLPMPRERRFPPDFSIN